MRSVPENLLRKELLIFDFDGTVADTSTLHAQAFGETLAPLGIEIDYQRIAGRRTEDALLACFTDAGRVAPNAATLVALTATKQHRVRTLIAERLEPLPGVDHFLGWARSRYRMALVTSGSRGTVELALERLGYQDLFNPALFSEDVRHAKPHPEGFLKVLEMTGIAAPAALVFEDAQVGFEAAAAAGVEYLDIRNLDWLSMASL